MPTMGTLESRFADLIWSHEPMASKDLIKMAEKELNWKSSTSYTVLKRLCERGIFQLQDKTVTSLISREEFYGMKSEQFLDRPLTVLCRRLLLHSEPERSCLTKKWRC